jgi:hypothetical protein
MRMPGKHSGDCFNRRVTSDDRDTLSIPNNSRYGFFGDSNQVIQQQKEQCIRFSIPIFQTN